MARCVDQGTQTSPSLLELPTGRRDPLTGTKGVFGAFELERPTGRGRADVGEARAGRFNGAAPEVNRDVEAVIAIVAKARAAATYDAGRFFDEPDWAETAEMRLPNPFTVDQDFASEMFGMLVALTLAPERAKGDVGDSKALLTFVLHAIPTRGIENF